MVDQSPTNPQVLDYANRKTPKWLVRPSAVELIAVVWSLIPWTMFLTIFLLDEQADTEIGWLVLSAALSLVTLVIVATRGITFSKRNPLFAVLAVLIAVCYWPVFLLALMVRC